MSDDKKSEKINADLIVDASGQAAHLNHWLKEIGYPLPPIIKITTKLSYSTTILKVNPDLNLTEKILSCSPRKPAFYACANMFAIENGFYMCSLFAYHNEPTPVTQNEFIEYTKNIERYYIYEAIKDAEFIGEISQFITPEMRHIHYEKLKNFPKNIVPLGDAIARFDPVFGQGMTLAVLSVCALEQELKLAISNKQIIGTEKFITQYFKKNNRKINVAWLLAAYEICLYPENKAQRPFAFKLVRYYLDYLIKVSTQDSQLIDLIASIYHMSTPPTALLRPWVLKKCIRYAFGFK